MADLSTQSPAPTNSAVERARAATWMTTLKFPDPLMKWFLKKGVNYHLSDKHGVAVELMRRCINENTADFGLTELRAIEPRYETQLHTLINDALKNPKHIWQEPEGTVVVLNLATALGESKEPWAQLTDLSTPTAQRSDSELRRDLARALGHVHFVIGHDGNLKVRDMFDQPSSIDAATEKPVPSDVKSQLHYMARNGATTGDVTKGLLHIFCPENPDTTPSRFSIPVVFPLKAEQFDPELLGKLSSKPPTEPETAQVRYP